MIEKVSKQLIDMGMRVPRDYFVTAGVGESDYQAHAGSFHLALREARIEEFNIMAYSSIMPGNARQITKPTDLVHGAVLETIIAQSNVNQGECATAAIIYGWLYDKRVGNRFGGLVCEYNGKLSEKDAGESLRGNIRELHTNGYEHYDLKDITLITKSFVPEKKFGTALVAICFVNYTVPIGFPSGTTKNILYVEEHGHGFPASAYSSPNTRFFIAQKASEAITSIKEHGELFNGYILGMTLLREEANKEEVIKISRERFCLEQELLHDLKIRSIDQVYCTKKLFENKKVQKVLRKREKLRVAISQSLDIRAGERVYKYLEDQGYIGEKPVLFYTQQYNPSKIVQNHAQKKLTVADASGIIRWLSILDQHRT
ncbi:MAG: pyruvoyl-dependent arginine decarboxylase [Candidatus Woesearchaeota archaeon]